MAGEENSTFDILKGWTPLKPYETFVYGPHNSTAGPQFRSASPGDSGKTVAVTDRLVANEINKLVGAVSNHAAGPPVRIDLSSVGGLGIGVWFLAIAIVVHALVLLAVR